MIELYCVHPLQGMACVGRTKVCTIVPSNHFGPIPGVHVGTLWKFRVQVWCVGGGGERMYVDTPFPLCLGSFTHS